MKGQEKQVIYSGILGDGHLTKRGSMSYNCHFKEYMDFKHSVLFDYRKTGVGWSANQGYKKGSDIYKFSTVSMELGMELLQGDPIATSIENLNEFGLALLMYDDGSRHKKHNFYNICTHALSDRHQNMLIEKLKEFNVFADIFTETKKDGRTFSYLYVSKWNGAMELSRMMRDMPLECYTYKLVPKELEDIYFEVKDTDEFKNKDTAFRKTNYIKKMLGLKKDELIQDNLHSDVFVKD